MASGTFRNLMTSQLTGNTQALLSEQSKKRRQRKPSLQQIIQLSVLNNVSQIGHGYIIILGANILYIYYTFSKQCGTI